MTAVDPRFERSVRRWLWAYPRRWRWARADEVVGTLADLAAPGETRLGVRAGLGLVVHGLATRRRLRPPFRVRLRYRLISGPLPAQYRGWVADDIASPWFQAGPLLGLGLGQSAFALLRWHDGYATAGQLIWPGLFLLTMVVVPKTRARRAAAAHHLVARPGDPPAPWDLAPGWVYRDRISARSFLPPAAAAAALVTSVAAALTGAAWHRGPVALAACLAAGSLAAALLTVRWRRWAPGRPEQPARRVVAAGRRWTAAIWCFAAVAVATSAPASILYSGDGPGLAPVVLGLGFVVLPPLACGALLSRAAAGDIALVDVWWLVAWPGPRPVDSLQRGVVAAWPASGAPQGAGYDAPPPDPALA